MNKIGIIAGEGKMPVYIASKAKERGYEVFVVGAKGNAQASDYQNIATKFKALRLGQLGACISFFQENKVTQVVMAGRVQHTSIFTNLMPDLRGAKFLATLKNMQTKNILSSVIKEFQKDGINFSNSALFLEDFMPAKGVLTKAVPTAEDEKSIAFGYKIAKAIAQLDIGLTCVVSQSAVIAVEGMEGTDNCILRAGELYKKSAEKKTSVAVVKVSRPDQDKRFDLPVVGKGTIESMKKADIHILAIEAQKTLVLDLEDVIKLANQHHIIITAI